MENRAVCVPQAQFTNKRKVKMVTKMAEFCRKCFISRLMPSKYDIDHIVMSEDEDFCEGCMKWGKYVDHIDCSERKENKE